MSTVTPALGAEQRSILEQLRRCSALRVDFGADLIEFGGDVIRELSPLAGPGQATVRRDCTQPVAGRFDFAIDEALAWGRDIIAPYQLLSSAELNDGTIYRFPLGAYVATSPETLLRDPELWNVIAYGLPYLLRGGLEDTFSADDGTLYATNVAEAFARAGVTDAQRDDGNLNPDVVSFPADWAVKVIPTPGAAGGGPMVFPADASGDITYLDVINALLKASGMQPLYDDQTGRFVISPIPVPARQSPLWVFSQSLTDADPDFDSNEAVTADPTYNTDVWNLPNRLIYIQSGLTFEPQLADGSDGRYVIDNAATDPAHYRPPSDQDSIGRVIARTVTVDASGQDDLIKQAEAAYTALFASAESFALTTMPWPAAWHLDVFTFASSLLPYGDSRRVQAQSWVLPLRGEKMTWTANAVSTGINE